MMQALCRKKDVASVPRDLGLSNRVWAKNRQPQRKKNIDIRDLTQP
jgi:hypothetical protein